MRLHYSVLAQSSQRNLLKEVRRGDTWKFNAHAGTALVRRNISIGDARDVIRTGDFIEYNDDFGTRHVLLRGKSGVCVVVDLDLEEIATVYANHPDDNHQTINSSRYLGGVKHGTTRRT